MSGLPKPAEVEPPHDTLEVTEADIDTALAEASGDPREAIRMLLRDLAVMALDADAASSKGYLGGRFSEGHRRRPWAEEV
jgi:hypothetical protein